MPSPQPRPISAEPIESNGGTKLWFTLEHYIEVDASGYLLNLCLEGAMGYVIRIAGVSGTPMLAWKIPRLVGDSLRENGYIAYLLQLEAENVRLMESAKCDAVLGCQVALTNPFLIAVFGFLVKDRPQPADSPNQRLFVSFEKGKRLRFCTLDLAGKVSGPRDVMPDEMIAGLQQELFNAGSLYRQSNASENPASKAWIPMYMESALEKEPVGWYCGLPSVLYNWAQGTLQEAISNGHLEKWSVRNHYELIKRVLSGIVALHSRGLLHGDLRPANIMYMSVATNPDGYKITDYGSFSAGAPEFYGNPAGGAGLDGKTVLQTIQNARVSAFYAPERRNGFEHEEADRALILQAKDSAWIVALGWRRLFESFRTEATIAGDKIVENPGNTGAQRASEKKDVLAFAVEKLVEPLPEDQAGKADVSRGEGDSNRIPLCKGDRLRLREYVFRVEDVGRSAASLIADSPKLAIMLERCTVLRCEKDVWKVFNERLVVQSAEFEAEFNSVHGDAPFEISLPKIVELYQWSKATDIYSVGVLLLYILFPRQERRHKEGPKADAVPDNASETTSERVIEREFFVLLDHLANPLYFKQMWTQVHLVCTQLLVLHEEAVKQEEAPEVFRRKTISPFAAKRIFNIRDKDSKSPEKGLYEAVRQAVNNICETTPHARLVLEHTFNWNIGLFILFIHFVFSCLHRQVDVRTVVRARAAGTEGKDEPRESEVSSPTAGAAAQKNEEERWLEEVMQGTVYPFAHDRLDDNTSSPTGRSSESPPAQRALERAEILLELCSSIYVRQLIAREKDDKHDQVIQHERVIADYEPKSQAEVLLEVARLRAEVSALTKDRERLIGVAQHINRWKVGGLRRLLLGRTGEMLEKIKLILHSIETPAPVRMKSIASIEPRK